MTDIEQKITIWAACKSEYEFLDLPVFVQKRVFKAWLKLDELAINGNLPDKFWPVYNNLSRNLQI